MWSYYPEIRQNRLLIRNPIKKSRIFSSQQTRKAFCNQIFRSNTPKKRFYQLLLIEIYLNHAFENSCILEMDFQY